MQSCPWKVALMFGSYATELHEPCQVRNEAALSGIFRVRKGAWAELTTKVTSVKARSKRNAHNKNKLILKNIHCSFPHVDIFYIYTKYY